MFCSCTLWSLWGLQKNLKGLRPNYSTTNYFSRARKWWQVVLITLKYSWKQGGTINRVLLLAITYISQRWEDRSKTLTARNWLLPPWFFHPLSHYRSELMSAQGIGWRHDPRVWWLRNICFIQQSDVSEGWKFINHFNMCNNKYPVWLLSLVQL